jgi:hypothetical protein
MDIYIEIPLSTVSEKDKDEGVSKAAGGSSAENTVSKKREKETDEPIYLLRYE